MRHTASLFSCLCLGSFLWFSGPVLAQTPAPPAPRNAEAAWQELMSAAQPPAPPAQWQLHAPTPEQQAEFGARVAELSGQAADKARAFWTSFPGDPKARQAREMEYQLLNQAAQLGDKARLAQVLALEEERLKDPATTEDERFDVRSHQVMRPFMRPPGADRTVELAELDASARNLQKEFPKRQEVYEILLTIAQAHLENSRPEMCRALAREIADHATGEPKESAAALLRSLDRLGQPLKLKFTSVLGDDIDVKKFRGKVVLVDFWATGCGPWRAALPEVMAIYKNLHLKGFEIVGISFDQSKEILQKFIAEQNMPWPQYYDGRGWENKFGREFGITSIPAMWLLDKKGNLRELSAREDLAGKVEKLLKEK